MGCKVVIESIENESEREKKTRNKWQGTLRKFLTEPFESVLPRFEILKPTEKACIDGAENIIVVSSLVKKQIVDFFHVDPSKICVINNAIPDYWFSESSDAFSDTPWIIFTSRADSSVYSFLEKGHDRAFQILSEVSWEKKIYLHFGTINESETYCQVVQENTGAEVVTGCKREELQKKYRAGDIFLATSRTESFMLTLIEAMASKMVPIAYPVGIAPDLIKNGENGYIVNSPGEAVEIVKKLQNDFDLRKKIALCAYDSVREAFRFERMISEYQSLVSEILKNK